jgi:hypothetical protein
MGTLWLIAKREHEELNALADKWHAKAIQLLSLRRQGTGLNDPNVILAEAQVYRECAKELKKLIGNE